MVRSQWKLALYEYAFFCVTNMKAIITLRIILTTIIIVIISYETLTPFVSKYRKQDSVSFLLIRFELTECFKRTDLFEWKVGAFYSEPNALSVPRVVKYLSGRCSEISRHYNIFFVCSHPIYLFISVRVYNDSCAHALSSASDVSVEKVTYLSGSDNVTLFFTIQ